MSEHGSGNAMSMARLRAILDAYGAEPRRWPAAERAGAEALIAASAEARALRDEAAALDDVLASAVAPAPSSALRAAVLQAAPRPQAASGFTENLRGLWQSLLSTLGGELGGWRPAGATLGVALLLGIATGGTIGMQPDDTTTVAAAEELDLLQLALFDDPYTGY